MKLLDLHISGFGKFHDRDLSFENGINIIYGKNEAGKSTVHTFIRCMLFGLERARGRASKNDLYSRCEPWEAQAVYGGRMRVEQRGIIYRIERNFRKEQKSFIIIDETHGREAETSKAFLSELLCGLTETSYINTVSIGQLKSATDADMISELKNYIANMNTAGSMALNITKASSWLQNLSKQYERRLVPEAPKEYQALSEEIRKIEAETAAPVYQNQLAFYRNTRDQLRMELLKTQKERETLLQRTASARQVLAESDFTNESSIIDYHDQINNAWNNYMKEEALGSKKTHPILSSVLLTLAILSAACAVFCWTAGKANPLAAMLNISGIFLISGFAALSLFLLSAALLTLRSVKSPDNSLTAYGELLQDAFLTHLGNSAISDEAMQAFDRRMDEMLRLMQALTKSETAAQEQAEKISSLRRQEQECEDHIARQQKNQWELEKKLERLAGCRDRMENLTRTITENKRIQEEIDSVNLALQTLTSLSSAIRSSFGPYLNQTASEMVKGTTGGAYDSMSVDENLNVFMNTPAKLVPISQISSGAADQIYLALRLAAAKLVQTGHDEMPLIFDDSFALYDDERLSAALKWLARAYRGQLLIFTCQQRESSLMSAERIPHKLIEI